MWRRIWPKMKLPRLMKARGIICPIGASRAENGPPLKSVSEAVAYLLERLRAIPSPPDPTLTTRERNIIIRARHAAGVSQADLAREFGISYQRVHQIVHS
ncbi:hypothetical protein GF356_03610 [candidate division GN15 bacterium]|nr:hypothetical protein [candidate division GN15 bacterium]